MKEQEKKLIPIPADIWDTLEFSALAFGGIGADLYVEEGDYGEPLVDCPRCIHGHTAAVLNGVNTFFTTNEVADALVSAVRAPDGTLINENDTAVHAINERKGAPKDARVSWEEYTAEMGWVRGA